MPIRSNSKKTAAVASVLICLAAACSFLNLVSFRGFSELLVAVNSHPNISNLFIQI